MPIFWFYKCWGLCYNVNMKEELLRKVSKLIKLHKQGELGGDKMPEDSNPGFEENSRENLIYFTLPMALNYQRNSYTLWESALLTWQDEECKDVFAPEKVVDMSIKELQQKLTKHKVALQQNKQPLIWQKLCQTFYSNYKSDIRILFKECDNDIVKIKELILKNKKDFPYLSGTKILNYWLYVITQYSNTKLKNSHAITVAPDTHVIQASLKLGVINKDEMLKSNIREVVAQRWADILKDTDIQPIDIHTPFWLWSRNGFTVEV